MNRLSTLRAFRVRCGFGGSGVAVVLRRLLLTGCEDCSKETKTAEQLDIDPAVKEEGFGA